MHDSDEPVAAFTGKIAALEREKAEAELARLGVPVDVIALQRRPRLPEDRQRSDGRDRRARRRKEDGDRDPRADRKRGGSPHRAWRADPAQGHRTVCGADRRACVPRRFFVWG
jgi:hypothetical protein